MFRAYPLLLAVAACGPVKGTPPDTDGAPGDSEPTDPGFRLTLLDPNPFVPLDGSAALEIGVTRVGGFAGEITVAGLTPPNGLQIMPTTIAADATAAEVVVGALGPLAIGDTVDFDLQGTATGVTDQTLAITDADITGKPGSLDIAFGPVGTGYTSISFGNDDGGQLDAIDVVGGNILVLGTGVGGLGTVRMSAARFTATGAVDTTFNGGTMVRRTYGTSSGDFSEGLAIGHQMDGRPIFIGHHNGSGLGNDFAVSRVSVTGGDGGVDFGSLSSPNGRALIDLAGGSEQASDGLVLADGRIVIVGASNTQHAVALVTATGSLDTGFNGTGFVRESIGAESRARAVAVDAQGRILVAGTTGAAGNIDIVLSRYTATGLDAAFGTNGHVVVVVPGTNEDVVDMAFTNGKIVVACSVNGRYQLRRFEADGTADPTFGMNGVSTVTAVGTPQKLVVLPDGKLLMLGDTFTSGELVRFKSNGQPDPLFGTDSHVTVPFGDNAIVHAIGVINARQVVIGGGNGGGIPGPGTNGVVARIWM